MNVALRLALTSSIAAMAGCGPVYLSLRPPPANVIARTPQRHTFLIDRTAQPVCTASPIVRDYCFTDFNDVANSALDTMLASYLEPADAAPEFLAHFQPLRFSRRMINRGYRTELEWRFDLVTRTGVTVIHLEETAHSTEFGRLEDIVSDLAATALERVHVALNESIIAGPQPGLDAYVATNITSFATHASR